MILEAYSQKKKKYFMKNNIKIIHLIDNGVYIFKNSNNK